MRLRYCEKVNDSNIGSSIIASIAVNALNGFSKTNKPSVKPQEFLPFQLQNTSKNPYWDKVSKSTCSYIREKLKKDALPSQLIRMLSSNQEFYAVLLEKK